MGWCALRCPIPSRQGSFPAGGASLGGRVAAGAGIGGAGGFLATDGTTEDRLMGAGLGAGLTIGQGMAQAMTQAMQPGAAVVAPIASVAGAAAVAGAAGSVSADDVVATLEKLHRLVVKGILSQAEFDAKKAELLGKLS